MNARGEVVGITTAMSTRRRGRSPRPSPRCSPCSPPQLRERGSVARGHIGASLGDVTPALRRALRVAPSTALLVEDVLPDTPAERLGLRPYDVVVRVDGGACQLRRRTHPSHRGPGPAAGGIDVWRTWRDAVQVKLTDRPFPRRPRRRAASWDVCAVSRRRRPLGLSVRDPDAADYPAAARHDAGVVIIGVDPTGPSRTGLLLRFSWWVLELNRRRISPPRPNSVRPPRRSRRATRPRCSSSTGIR